MLSVSLYVPNLGGSDTRVIPLVSRYTLPTQSSHLSYVPPSTQSTSRITYHRHTYTIDILRKRRNVKLLA